LTWLYILGASAGQIARTTGKIGMVFGKLTSSITFAVWSCNTAVIGQWVRDPEGALASTNRARQKIAAASTTLKQHQNSSTPLDPSGAGR